MFSPLERLFNNQQKGFSLIEVLLVLTILGILTAVVIPVLDMVLDYHSLDTTAGKMAANMRLAQSHAITTNQFTRLVFHRFSNLYMVELSLVKEWIDIPQGISICAINFPKSGGRETLTFNSLGTPNQGGHVGLENRRGDKLYVIITPVTGRVRISKNPP
ncbi:GspH/FimT family pseudopilin [Candidatus Contubernalis alkaliaceticus]|uniref:GspH/FimT family pseudopilin n=1 Tax=Candidatus Contubernalis alkaliaceticus TaxID=338645 RepID=UPI00240A950A|nr:GspH/FimT family pseudopilin [Candidatus Contubernalis alkalaceticus]UNC92564.1 prepilin-type N-terminal cleavage/methylation domain-containing protein [Candidatus Contubernalis alkalaceticus]